MAGKQSISAFGFLGLKGLIFFIKNHLHVGQSIAGFVTRPGIGSDIGLEYIIPTLHF